MVQVPEIFEKYIGSFAGCVGGNPDAPIWLVCDHAKTADLPIDPEKAFANPVTCMGQLAKPLPAGCKCAPSVARLINSIVGNKEDDIGLVFKPEGQEKDQPIFLMTANPIHVSFADPEAWTQKPVIQTPDGVKTLAQYTGLEKFSDYINYLIETRGKVFRAADEKRAPKIILCQGFLKANDYFKFFGADRNTVTANDFFLAAPVKNADGTVRSIVFVTDMLGFGAGDMTPENEIELQEAGLEFRHLAYDVFGDDWLGKFAGELLTLGK